MNKPLLLSLAAATILGTNLSAESMYDRIQMMELQMKQMQQELDTLKSQEAKAARDEEETENEDATTKNEDGNDEKIAKADSDEEADDEKESIEDQIAEMQENISELNKNTNGNHLKFGADYRFSVDNLQYKMADGSKYNNDAFLTNRFWMNMNWAPTKQLSFRAQLAYYKAYGQRMSGSSVTYNYETFDWIVNENPYDDSIRLRSAYFLYQNDTFLGTDVPWTFSVGRRPSTNGHLINLRDDDPASSPMGHTINVEFDGLSAKFNLEDVIGVEGMYVKLCAGRGMSIAQEKFTPTPYSDGGADNKNIDLIGLIFVPYDNGQYSVATQYYYASNLIEQDFNVSTGTPLGSFTTVGGMHSVTMNFVANGIGDGISEFLDDTIFFLSGAVNITDPEADQRMLYSAKDTNGNITKPGESKTGYSGWAGLQFPSLISEDGRWGIEYNWGSQYWKSITYAEDTLIGSKVAARGSAYEAYFTEYLIEDILSFQIRYTYIDYDYKGSNGFFGSTTGGSDKISDITNPLPKSRIIDTAQNIRFYLRYRY